MTSNKHSLLSNRLWDRRSLNASIMGSLLTGVSLSGVKAATHQSPAVMTDRATLLPFLRKLKYAGDDRLVIWWLEVQTYAVVDSELIDLFAQHIVSLHKAETRDDGFDAISLELIFHADPKTFEFVEAITNPLTGETVTLPQRIVGPTRLSYLFDQTELPEQLPGVTFAGDIHLGPAYEANGSLWLDEKFVTRVSFTDGVRPDYYVNDLSTYEGSYAELMNSEKPFVSSRVAFNSITSWPEWLKMGEQKGSKFSRGSGQNALDFNALPRTTLQLMERFYPDILQDPDRALRNPPATFE